MPSSCPVESPQEIKQSPSPSVEGDVRRPLPPAESTPPRVIPPAPAFRRPVRQPLPPLPTPSGQWPGAWWLALPGALILLSMVVYAIREMSFQRLALASAEAQLAVAKQEHDDLEAHRTQLGVWQQQLEIQKLETRQLQSRLVNAVAELQGVKEKSSAREQELEQLVAFLKAEIEASELQMKQLQQSLGVKPVIRRALP